MVFFNKHNVDVCCFPLWSVVSLLKRLVKNLHVIVYFSLFIICESIVAFHVTILILYILFSALCLNKKIFTFNSPNYIVFIVLLQRLRKICIFMLVLFCCYAGQVFIIYIKISNHFRVYPFWFAWVSFSF